MRSIIQLVRLSCILLLLALTARAGAEDLTLPLRYQVKLPDGKYETRVRQTTWNPRETAAVICDMWDKHWCKGATRRVAEMAPRMNELVKELRRRGVLIIHCPSDTMEYYRDAPQRKLAQNAPPVETKVPLKHWCSLDEAREGKLPIDDSDGGCDCQPQCKNYRAWTKQIDAIEIEKGDAITDSAEAFYLMKQRGIKNVIVMGVHTNMCVLGRPFSIRQMVQQGQNVALARDMTDTMYNSRRPPYVNHFAGTDLVVSHIERHWCPTFTSADLLGGKPFRFSKDPRAKAGE
jgi:nicotinamidase-related amidase